MMSQSKFVWLMHDLFISFSSRDSLVAEAARHYLERRSIRCWKAPESIPPGEIWEEAITNAIASSKGMLLIWSRESQDSKQVCRELTLAASQEKVIIPFRIEEVEPKGAFAYYLTNTHWLDVINDDLQSDLARLAQQVETILSSVALDLFPEDSSKTISADGEPSGKTIPGQAFILTKGDQSSLLSIWDDIRSLLHDPKSHFSSDELLNKLNFSTDETEILNRITQINPTALAEIQQPKFLCISELLVGKLGRCTAVLLFMTDGMAWIERDSWKRYPIKDCLQKILISSALGCALEIGDDWIWINTFEQKCDPEVVEDLFDYLESLARVQIFEPLLHAGENSALAELIDSYSEWLLWIRRSPESDERTQIDIMPLLESLLLAMKGESLDSTSLLNKYQLDLVGDGLGRNSQVMSIVDKLMHAVKSS